MTKMMEVCSRENTSLKLIFNDKLRLGINFNILTRSLKLITSLKQH